MIRMKNISKSFGEKQIFRDFSADIPEGKTTCLTGVSGSGKTTLLRILSGLETLDAGEIIGLSERRLSVVFQEDRLCENLSPISNVRLAAPSGTTRESIRSGMTSIGLSDCEKQPVRELSGGMRRRVAILRALFAQYDFLLLDEPFKGLDEESKRQTISFIKEHAMDMTILLITHDHLDAAAMGTTVEIRL